MATKTSALFASDYISFLYIESRLQHLLASRCRHRHGLRVEGNEHDLRQHCDSNTSVAPSYRIPCFPSSTTLASSATPAPALSGLAHILKPLKDLLRVRAPRSRYSVLFTASSPLRLRRSGSLSSRGYRLATAGERGTPASKVSKRACRADCLSWYRRSERRAGCR